MKRKQILIMTGVLAASAFAVVVPMASSALATTCPDELWGNFSDLHTQFGASGVNIRSGPSTSCAIRGKGYLTQAAEVHCYTRGEDGYNWVHVRNTATGVQGWSRHNLVATALPEPCTSGLAG